MFGFLDRLDDWLRLGALGELDPAGAPLHPPVAYEGADHMVIPRANTPHVPEGGWRGLAVVRCVSDRRSDIVAWAPFDSENPPDAAGAAILLDRQLTFFEFPRTVAGLLLALTNHGLALQEILLTLQWGALRRGERSSLIVVIGSPMRGIAGSDVRHQHLVAWLIEETVAKDLLTSINRYFDDDDRQASGKAALDRLWEWAKEAKVRWCRLREDRPEVTVRRDRGTPSSWFAGKRIAVWGCGAIGGYVADFVVRSGARSVLLVDTANVAPGVLVRQPFVDSDINRSKAEVLAERLREVFPGVTSVKGLHADIVTTVLDDLDWAKNLDVILDCTASRTVLKKLEMRSAESTGMPVSVASLVVGPRASRGLVAVAPRGFSGGPSDVLRKAKLQLLRNGPREILDEFWPGNDTRDQELFQPEPGCSDITFAGSAADVAGLAASMVSRSALHLAEEGEDQALVAWVPPTENGSATGPFDPMKLHADTLVGDDTGGYQVRVSPSAWSRIQHFMMESRRRRGPKVETGGVLFGQRDDASRVVWIDEVMGPPLDSEASEHGFLCGTIGVRERHEELELLSEGTIRFVGMWHTHPGGTPSPSSVDYNAARRLLALSERSTERVLMLIIGGNLEHNPEPVAYSFSKRDFDTAGSHTNLRVYPLYPLRVRMHYVFAGGRASLHRVQDVLHTLALSLGIIKNGEQDPS